MNKQPRNDETGAAYAETVIETMKHPDFAPEQLPEQWQQLTNQGVTPQTLGRELRECWRDGIETLWQRCGTFPQHAKLAAALSGLPDRAWHSTKQATTHAGGLLRQATTGQLVQALKHEQAHPGGWWKASSHILATGAAEQLTRPVIEQLPWGDTQSSAIQHQRRQLVIEHIQQQLLENNKAAWNVFCGIVDAGTIIGEATAVAAAVAAAVEH